MLNKNTIARFYVIAKQNLFGLLRRNFVSPRNDENALWHGAEHLPHRNDKKFRSPSPISLLTSHLSRLTVSTRNDTEKLTFRPFNPSTFQPAFTLAEVLITLGIIGVVAMMTIPAIKTYFDKQATITGYQRAYSILSQAVRLSEAENGMIDTWNFPTTMNDTAQSLTFFNTYLAPYLSISKRCDTASGCWALSKKPNGTPADVTSDGTIRYILNDGMALSICNYGSSLMGIFVDINGLKNPNTMGKDVFCFILVQRAAYTVNRGNGNLAEGVKIGGIYPDGFGLDIAGSNYQYRGCGKDVTYYYAGVYCGAKIVKDGYQIKDDYPW